jgi:hypothetical protein
MTPDEQGIIHDRCAHAKEAGVIVDWSYYHDWAQEKRVFEIFYPDRGAAEEITKMARKVQAIREKDTAMAGQPAGPETAQHQLAETSY